MVQFIDTSDGPVSSWSWDFGDGTRSTLQNPSHLFEAPGAYTVRLTCSNANGSNTRTRPGYVLVVARNHGPIAARD
jgi:PKD repeat protein